MKLKHIVTIFFLSLILAPLSIYSTIFFTQDTNNTFDPDIAAVFGSGIAGTSDIGINGTTANVTVTANWLGNWSKRMKISINSNFIDNSLTNFPGLLLLSNSSGQNNDDVSRVFDELLSDINRKKIAVTTDDGQTQCYVEIEQWDDANEQAWLWVNIPTISNATDTDLYLYYDVDHADNTDYVGDVGSSTSQNVWSNSYEAVYHLNDDFLDSSSGNHHGTNYNSSDTTGMIADAQYFYPSDGVDYIDIGTWSVPSSQITLQAWIKSDDNFAQDDPRILSKATGSASDQHVWMMSLYNGDSGENRLRFRLKTGTSDSSGTTTLFGAASDGYLPNSNNWYLVAMSYNGSNMQIIRDDLEGGSTAKTGNLRENTWSINIGNNPGNTDTGFAAWYGKIDEVRISSVARSIAWMKAEYESGRDNLFTFSAEEVNTVDYIDTNLSNRDGSADKGTHSNFSAQQEGPDTSYGRLTEENTGMIQGYQTQQGTVVLTSTNQTQNITPVNSTDRAFVLISHFYAQPNRTASSSNYNPYGNPDRMCVSAYLVNTTTIRFERGSSATDAVISYIVVECFNAEFQVYRGSQSFSGTTTSYYPAIGGTVNGTNCFTWINGAWTDTTSDRATTRYLFFTANVSDGSQSTLNIIRGLGANGVNGSLRWIVVEFDVDGMFPGAIDRGDIVLSNQYDNTPATATVTGCNKSQSLLLAQMRTTGDDGLNTHAFAAYLEDSTHANFYVYDSSYSRTVQWYVIDFGNGVVSNQGNRYESTTVSFKIYMDLLGTGETSPSVAETVGYVVVDIEGSQVHGTHGGVTYEAGLVGNSVVNGHDDTPESWSYSTAFTTKPTVAFISSDTNGGSDGRIMVYDTIMSSNTSISIHVDEDEIGDSEQSHSGSEDGFYLVFETSGNHTGGSGKLKCEWNTINLTDSWTTINLVNSYSSPVIVSSYNEGIQAYFRPLLTRIRNVTSSSFEIHVVVDNKTTGITSQQFSYFVAEEGEYEFDDGTKILIGSSTSTEIHQSGTSGTGFGSTQAVTTSFGWSGEPAIFCFIQRREW